jgi:hypothetical protein
MILGTSTRSTPGRLSDAYTFTRSIQVDGRRPVRQSTHAAVSHSLFIALCRLFASALLQYALGGCGIVRELFQRPSGARDEFAATVGALVPQYARHAVDTEAALDPCHSIRSWGVVGACFSGVFVRLVLVEDRLSPLPAFGPKQTLATMLRCSRNSNPVH